VKKIIAILLICSVALYAAPPFTLETVIPKLYRLKGVSNNAVSVPIVDYIELQRNLDKIERKIRESDARADSNFVQIGTLDSTSFDLFGGLFIDTVFLPQKYESTSGYRVFISRFLPPSDLPANPRVYSYSDSAFIIQSDVEGNGIYWLAIGIRKK
jgi:hypothetical protein